MILPADVSTQLLAHSCAHCGHLETWKPIPAYDGLYEASTLGRVRSVERTVIGRRYPSRTLDKRRVVFSIEGEYTYTTAEAVFFSQFSTAPPGANPIYRDGNPEHRCIDNLGWEFPHLNYHPMHRKVRQIRGSASEHPCIDCGGQRAEWSYTRSGYCEATQATATGTLRYSLDPAEYEPRCRPCHRRHDEAGVWRPRDSAGRWLAGGAA